MLDDLRNSSSFIEEEEPQDLEQENAQRRSSQRRRKETFLGMTAQQRFLLALMLFIMVCVLGAFALFISGSMVLPF